MLVASLEYVAAQAPAELAAEQALLEASVLLSALDQLRAVALARVADIDIRQLHVLDGSPSTSSWVAEQHTGMDRSQVALARKLQGMPQVAARIADGEISLDGGVLVGKALSRVRRFVDRPDGLIDGQPAEEVLGGVIVNGVGQLVAEAQGGLADDHPLLAPLYDDLHKIYTAPQPDLARLEAAFLLLARHIEPHHLQRALACLVDAVLPSQLADRADDSHQERSLDLIRDVDASGWLLRGRLDAETGELLHMVIAAAMATDPDNPADTASDVELRAQGLDPYEDGCLRRRSTTQRRHDALRLVLGKVLGSNFGQPRKGRGQHRRHHQRGRHARPAGRPARPQRVRRYVARRPGSPLALRQRRHPLRPQHRTPSDREQPCRADAETARAHQAPGDRWPVPGGRLQPRRSHRPHSDSTSCDAVCGLSHDEAQRHGAGLRGQSSRRARGR